VWSWLSNIPELMPYPIYHLFILKKVCLLEPTTMEIPGQIVHVKMMRSFDLVNVKIAVVV
jgi:hypothetical protein